MILALLVLALLTLVQFPSVAIPATKTLEPLAGSNSIDVIRQIDPPGSSTAYGNRPQLDYHTEIDYHFDKNGTVEWKHDGDEFRLGAPRIGIQPFQATGIFRNSSTIEITFQSTLTPFAMQVFYNQKETGYEIILNGTVTGILGLPLLNPLGLQSHYKQTNGTITRYTAGSIGLDWSDTLRMNPVFNVGLGIVQWTLHGSFNLDPVTVADSQVCAGTSPSCSASLTTTKTNDIIIVFAICTGGASPTCHNGLSDAQSLTWTERVNVNFVGHWFYNEWWAYSSAALSADSITLTSSATDILWVAFGVNGALSFVTPFDVAGTAQSTGTSNPPPPSTSIAPITPTQDLIIGASGYGVNTATENAGIGFQPIVTACCGSAGQVYALSTEAKSVGTASQVVDFTGAGGQNQWDVIAEGIVGPLPGAGNGAGGGGGITINIPFIGNYTIPANVYSITTLGTAGVIAGLVGFSVATGNRQRKRTGRSEWARF